MYDNKRLERFTHGTVVPWITYEAAIFLYQHIDEFKHVFEWGSGSSTFFFARHAKYLTSVEHHEGFYHKIQRQLRKAKIKNVTYVLRPPREEDLPKDARKPNSFKSEAIGQHLRQYVLEIEQFSDDFFDLVFVDGRARPSCLIRALPKVKSGGILMLDNSDQKKYRMSMRMIPKSWKRKDFKGWGRKDPTRPCSEKAELMSWMTTIWRKEA